MIHLYFTLLKIIRAWKPVSARTGGACYEPYHFQARLLLGVKYKGMRFLQSGVKLCKVHSTSVSVMAFYELPTNPYTARV